MDASEELFEIGARRITCAGGTASIDMMLDLISPQSARRSLRDLRTIRPENPHSPALRSSAHGNRRALRRAQPQADSGDRRDGTKHGKNRSRPRIPRTKSASRAGNWSGFLFIAKGHADAFPSAIAAGSRAELLRQTDMSITAILRRVRIRVAVALLADLSRAVQRESAQRPESAAPYRRWQCEYDT